MQNSSNLQDTNAQIICYDSTKEKIQTNQTTGSSLGSSSQSSAIPSDSAVSSSSAVNTIVSTQPISVSDYFRFRKELGDVHHEFLSACQKSAEWRLKIHRQIDDLEAKIVARSVKARREAALAGQVQASMKGLLARRKQCTDLVAHLNKVVKHRKELMHGKEDSAAVSLLLSAVSRFARSSVDSRPGGRHQDAGTDGESTEEEIMEV